MVVVTLLGALLAPFVALWLLVSAIADLVPRAARVFGRTAPSRPSAAVVKLTGLVVLAVSPWAAARWAESANGWTDPDGDGMYAEMTNGSYDWFDINGGAWIRGFGVTSLLVLVSVLFALRAAASSKGAEPASADDIPDGLPFFPQG